MRPWTPRVLASALPLPARAKAFTPCGKLVKAPSAAGPLTGIDLVEGQRRAVARHQPVGRSGGPGLSPPRGASGVAEGADGAVDASADRSIGIDHVRGRC